MSSNKPSKSKPITTSVPSFAIRFHAGGEELEELYPSEEEEKSTADDKSMESTGAEVSDVSKHESSPMRDYLNKFGKRSSSIDTGINETATLTSQTTASDPWRIFSEFKGKFTKTVEEKFSEIKSKNHDSEHSPRHVNKVEKFKISGSKENSSISDSEEQSVSECSVPKSAADDLELSSEDEHSLAESEKTPTENINKDFPDTSKGAKKKHGLRHRFKSKPFVQFNPSKDVDSENQIKISSLSTVHEKDSTPVEDEVESGIEAYEDFTSPREIVEDKDPNAVTLIAPAGYVDLRKNVKRSNVPKKTYRSTHIHVRESLSDRSITSSESKNFGVEISEHPLDHETELSHMGGCKPFARPDLILSSSLLWTLLIIIIFLCIFFPLSSFTSGLFIGILLATCACYIYFNFYVTSLSQTNVNIELSRNQLKTGLEMPILEIQAAKEYQPVTKFEGWMNEYPEYYDPTSYHILKTQSVFLKLEGTVLRVSHTRSKIPKRAMWDEPNHKVVFSHHRIYNLKGSQILLLPHGLIHKRLWSKKYPICIILNKEYMHKDIHLAKKVKDDPIEIDDDKKMEKSGLLDNANITKDNETTADYVPDNLEEAALLDPVCSEDEKDIFSESYSDVLYEDDKDEVSINAEDWDTLTLDEANMESKIYLFARTCRDKEDWYRRMLAASQNNKPENEKSNETTPVTPTSDVDMPSTSDMTENTHTADDVLPNEQPDNEIDYLRYMARYNQVKKKRISSSSPNPRRSTKLFRKKKELIATKEDEEKENEPDSEHKCNLSWLNALLARVLYDVFKYNTVVDKLQHLIQRKLSTIKLPYFIEDIVISDLSLGNNSPIIERVETPSMDERGLWIFMDITYEGLIRMALVTKLNLMKLKQQAGKTEEPVVGNPSDYSDTRSPIFYSDVEDSAESSSDEDTTWLIASSDAGQDSATPKANTGGRKLLRMVDKIAASKYFQHATENKYIKRALEGVSNTEFRLNVEIQFLEGTLALNIPPPPSDRLWIGFKNNPKLQLSAHPTFGERSLNFVHVTRWIEKKLSLEFQKFLVLPNMEDFVIPMMNPKLSE